MHAERHTVTVTTNADGDGTGYTPPVTGRIVSIVYEKVDFANGVDVTITAEATGETIWAEENVNASTKRAPRQATHSTAGVAALYAAAGQPVLDEIVVANDRIKVVVAQGGNVKSGKFHVIMG